MIRTLIGKGFGLVMLICMACSDDPLTKEELGQQLFFEVQYSNNAWGTQFKGFLVDGKGQVFQYDFPSKWTLPDSKAGLTALQVQENLDASVLADLKIDPSSFQSHSQLVGSLGVANFSKRISGGADRGTLLYYAYQYDAQNGLYFPVLLAEDGNWEMHRQDVEAQVLITWLKDIESRLY